MKFTELLFRVIYLMQHKVIALGHKFFRFIILISVFSNMTLLIANEVEAINKTNK